MTGSPRETSGSLAIRRVRTGEDAARVVQLIRQFVGWLGERYADRLEDVESYVEKERLESQLRSIEQLAGLDQRIILLALVDNEPAGTVMLSRVDGDTCQMNRLYVSDQFRGLRIGRRLCEGLIEAARQAGYRRMRLHTTSRQFESRNLYLSLGFRPCDAYGAGGDMAEYYDMWLREDTEGRSS